jgi:hypothetical protein
MTREWLRQAVPSEQRPGAIFLGNGTHRERPGDAKPGIIEADSAGMLGCIKLVHLVKNLGVVLEGLETVGEPGRDVESETVGSRKVNGFMLPSSGRVFAQIDNHIVYGAGYAPHQLDLLRRRALVVQPAQGSLLSRAGEAALNELGGETVPGEFPCAEGSRKKAAIVTVGFEVNPIRAVESQGNKAHER